MKKIISLLLTAAVFFSLAACKKQEQNTTTTKATTSASTLTQTTQQQSTANSVKIPDTSSTENGKYEIAFITDSGQVNANSFNQSTWDGIKSYAYSNGKSYKFYQPANDAKATDTDRYNAMKAATEAGAKIIICTGYSQKEALKKAALEFPEVKFIFIDGEIIKNGENEDAQAIKNIAAIDYNEEQAGFLAGYAAVSEGYSKLGFIGGGDGTNPSFNRFAYGYVQGAEQAGKNANKEIELILSWKHGSTFAPSAELEAMLNGWYEKGTEIIFSCGGSLSQSAFAAASANEAAVIGCNVDQSKESDTVLTSAIKNMQKSVTLMLDKFYNNKWDEIGGKQTTLGVKENAVGLPTDTWKMKSFSVEAYNKLYTAIKDGKIKIDRNYDKLKPENFEKVKLTVE